MFTQPGTIEEIKTDLEANLPHLTYKIEKPLLGKQFLLAKKGTYGAIILKKGEKVLVNTYNPKGLAAAFGMLGIMITRAVNKQYVATRNEVFTYMSTKYYEVKKGF
ncbi:hypothetical protein MKQ70_15175 [Chitinophaga sedimenti]|uniref:hypothetical protein n=1 Tax=Chitinophaga sedimenti TaxID=2033606 RepID=UPI0020047FF1|nr:hypothetical protein [Chitinophaga sedimenti]MCK7556285.1 hypothetical protein [Chitinophaga sedimenti]